LTARPASSPSSRSGCRAHTWHPLGPHHKRQHPNAAVLGRTDPVEGRKTAGSAQRFEEWIRSWSYSLPANVADSATAEALRAICEIDLTELNSVESSARLWARPVAWLVIGLRRSHQW